jgi:hypothetical protein
VRELTVPTPDGECDVDLEEKLVRWVIDRY